MLSPRPLLAATAAAALASTAAVVPVAVHADPDPQPNKTVVDCETVDDKLRCGDELHSAFYTLDEGPEGGEAHAVLDHIAPLEENPEEYPTSFIVPTHVNAAIDGGEPQEWPVTVIGSKAFMKDESAGLPDLKTITFAEGSAVHTFGEQAFAESGIEEFTVPDTVTTLEPGVWKETASLSSIDFGDSQITTIPEGAFRGSGLKSVEIPASVTVIGKDAFMSAMDLHVVTFAEDSSLTTLEASALSYQVGQRGTLILPATVTTVSEAAIGAAELEGIVFTNADPAATLNIESNSISTISGRISVPDENADLYSALDKAVASPASEASLLSAKSFSVEDHDPEGEVTIRHASREVFVNPVDGGDPLPEEVMLSLGVVGGSMSTYSYDAFSNGEKFTVTSRDKTNSVTYTVRFNQVGPPDATRHFGDSRFQTSCETTRAALAADPTLTKPGNQEIIVTSGYALSDSGVGAGAANFAGIPMLTVHTDYLPECTRDLIKELEPAKIHIVGGTGAVGTVTEAAMGAVAPDAEFNRLFGNNRIATAEAVARHFFTPTYSLGRAIKDPAVMVVDAYADADLVTAASGAGLADGPVIPVNGQAEKLDDSTVQLISDLYVDYAYVVGGTGVVSQGIEDHLAEIFNGSNVERFAGDNRYDTSAAVATALGQGAEPLTNATLANGETLADATAATPYTDPFGSAVLLSRETCVPAGNHGFAVGADHINLVGGNGVLSDDIALTVPKCTV